MIGFEAARHQVKRMEQLRGFPKAEEQPDGLKELIRALMCAESEAQAQTVIDDFVHWGSDFCPTPTAIRRAIYGGSEEIESGKLPDPRPTCPRCQGSGMLRISKKAMPNLPESVYEATCPCVLPNQGGTN